MRVLLAEDDELLGDGIQTGLIQLGISVEWVNDGVAVETALDTESFDVLVLDLGLPRKSGLDVLRALRGRDNTLPVLILTARDAVGDRVAGLDCGADDYVTKPFDLEELAARLRALQRRASGRVALVLEHGAVTLDPARHRVTRNGQTVELSPKEFRLLQTLLENRGQVVSKQRLTDILYGWTSELESNALEVHVHHLRRKLGRDFVETVRGIGYRVGDGG